MKFEMELELNKEFFYGGKLNVDLRDIISKMWWLFVTVSRWKK